MTIHRIRLVALAGALLLILAACGGDGTAEGAIPTLPSLSGQAPGGEPDATTKTTEAVDPEEAMLEYTECMSEHGIDMPDPGSNGVVGAISADSDTDFEAFEEAAADCDPILEDAFGDFELTPEQEAEFMDQQLAFAQCMRNEGVDWPDPDPSAGGVISIEMDDSVDIDTMNAAMEKCGEGLFGHGGGASFGVTGEGGTP